MASDLLIPSVNRETFSRGNLIIEGYRPRYNKSLDCGLDDVSNTNNNTTTTTQQQETTTLYQRGNSEGDILGLGSNNTRYLDEEATDELHDLPSSSSNKKINSHQQQQQRILCDRVNPEDSIRDMVTENDFYRFVLFKRHYDKYLQLSQKYEEARNIAYYLEEKYHEIKAERDVLAEARKELERRLEQREAQLLEKDEELFLQLERVVRLEDECDKLRAEKERFLELQKKLQTERDEALQKVRKIQTEIDEYPPIPRPPLPEPGLLWQMRQQAGEAEHQRRGMERARYDVVRQVTIIAREKNNLEKENERLRKELSDERREMNNYLEDLSEQKNRAHQSIIVLEKELSELQSASKRTEHLNSQFKKAMKHLATCKRRKCSVCNYTRAAFGDYADRYRNQRKLFSCIQAPLEDLRHWIRPSSSMDDNKQTLSASSSRGEGLESISNSGGSDKEDLLHSSPARAPPSLSGPSGISFIDSDESTASSDNDDDVSTTSYDEEENEECLANLLPNDTSLTSNSTAAGRAFSSDSGFSSELCDSKITHGDTTPSPPPQKSTLSRSKWTSSFRKLINKVSKR